MASELANLSPEFGKCAERKFPTQKRGKQQPEDSIVSVFLKNDDGSIFY